MVVLSLFGGIEAGRVALDKLGIIPTKYYSAEIDEYAKKTASHNYPDIIHIGSVTDVDASSLEQIDWLIGGPPCQDLSIAGKRAGLEGSRSSLFWEYVRILNEAKPKFFLVENVASMSKEAKAQITEALFGIEPVLINSALVSAQNRKRLFWVGKRNEDGTYSKVEVTQPEDRGIVLKDILEPIPLTDVRWKPLDDKYVGKVKERLKSFGITATYAGACPRDDFEKSNRTVVVGQFRNRKDESIRISEEQDVCPTLMANMGTGGNNVPYVIRIPEATKRGFCEVNDGDCVDMAQPNSKTRRGRLMAHKSNALTTSNEFMHVCLPELVWRKLTVRECARLQTFPDTFSFESVSNSRAYKGIGNSWTVDVISHIFSYLLKN